MNRDVTSEPARRPRYPVERLLRRLAELAEGAEMPPRPNPFGTAFSASQPPRRDFNKSAQK